LQSNPSSRTALWRLHRFARAASAADLQRSLDQDIRAFFDAIIRHFGDDVHWIAATAPAKSGGIDVWFRLPAAPADIASGAVWVRELNSCGLASQAVSGRN
jgi:hypothetical protein